VDNNRNMILAIVLSGLVLLGWTTLSERYFPAPKPVPAAVKPADPTVASTVPGVPGASTVPSVPGVVAKPVQRDVKAILAEGNRVAIETSSLKGSINLKGGQIDDLVLPLYGETVAKDSPPVRLLSPAGAKDSYFAGFGWMADGVAVPTAETLWTADQPKLTPKTPVTLRWDNGAGQVFAAKISIDDKYMFAIDQSVTNSAGGAIGIRPYAFVNRLKGAHSGGSMLAPTKDVDSWTMHIGPIGVFNAAANYEVDYDDVDSAGANGSRFQTKGGWLGFGETYWLTAIIPAQNAGVDAGFRAGGGSYQAEYLMPQSLVAPGKTLSTNSRLFAGAKEVRTLDGYEDSSGVPLFGKAIDWGWFEVIQKPIFYVLDWLFKLTSNFGFAIILLTFIVRGLMFPIAQRQFASMAGMRALQPKLKLLQERYKDDKPKLQQEMMGLYKTEKINPLGGCLPVLIQIPIFYALYKVLMLTIEMRHQPFIAWIKDLSGPDPANLMTAAHAVGATWFPAFLGIGVLSGLLGLTMYLQFKLNPAAPDPVQQQVFSVMPWIMMFLMAPFAAGLQLYWVTSNILTIAQQKWLYSKHPALKEPMLPVKK
jgi:YidC/Oxa1 family membrane protein insertase